MNTKQLFAIISAILIVSFLISGFLMDAFGRKKVIIGKIVGFLTLIFVMIILGFVNKTSGLPILSLYFIGMIFATFTFDLQIHGFESLCKQGRETYIISISATRIIGVGLLFLTFYFSKRWVYFFIMIETLTLILLALFIRYSFESPYYYLASTANMDGLKFIINSIAGIND
jgi:hypothetical protein